MITSRYLLKLVSRSFALCIPLLDSNKKNEVENQYLLARFLDTIEDSENTLENKIYLFGKFIKVLENEDLSGLEDLKESILNDSVAEHDRVLIKNSNLVFKTFFSFEPSVKKMSIHFLNSMGSGMLEYQNKSIETFEMLDDYCYYVASTVGLYLTNLVFIVDNIQLNEEDAIHFGRFLQKINILKDCRGDLKEGRFFLPLSLFEDSNPHQYFFNEDYKQKSLDVLRLVVENIKNEIEPTFRYIKSIDKKSNGFRVFTLISAIMASETLMLMQNNYNIFVGQQPVKMKKNNVFNIVIKSSMGYYTNEVIDNYLRKIL